MKEARYFFVPDAAQQTELPADEAMHALRVLRLKSGDEMFLMDGEGNYYRAQVTIAATHRCFYEILETMPQERQWQGRVHLAIAPTKMMDRIEWMVEKATEIGVDDIVAAVKQSHKAYKPQLHEIESFKAFIHEPREGRKFIAHCYEEVPRSYLFEELKKDGGTEDATVMIGPEGDFSIEEVKMAVEAGWQSVHLGKSRLRTETAGLSAIMMMQLAK